MEKGLINLLRNQEPAFKRSHFVQACGSAAWSRGLRVFAVHNGRECLGYSDVSATFSPLKVSQGCLGGKGEQNATDVYRFTIFMAKLTGLRATYVTFESVRVEWKPVPELFILGYKVLVPNTFSQFVPWNVNSTLMEGLHSNTSYVVTVFPVHGLAIKGIPPDSSQSIIVTTEADQGQNSLIDSRSIIKRNLVEDEKKGLRRT